ncbi:AMP-binding protein [Candidatus Woesearchaeota archaeon]|nr:AMP-binding protein [Candidatus Woesearchaeota archaeon]
MVQDAYSIQKLVYLSLLKNKKLSFSHKTGYRTKSINGQELLKKINAARMMLKRYSIKKADKVIILGNSSIEWVTIYFACILSNITAVPLDALTDKTLLQKICRQVEAKAVFQSISINLPAGAKIKSFYLEELDDKLKEFKTGNVPIDNANPEDPLEIQYTSGTTGDPKGVVLTHKNILTALQAATDALKLRIHLKFLNVLPLSHVFSQIMGILLPVYYGYGIYFIDSIRPKKLIAFIRNKRINAAIFVPGMLAAVKNDLEGKCVPCSLGIQFRLIGVGGASLDIDLEKWWKRKMIMVLNGYGMTETSSVISLNTPFASKAGSVGKIAQCVNVKLGEDGEILVKGDNITSGYYKNREKTISSFENWWFKTGDVGYIKNGYLYIKERKKDIIITSSGLKAYPVDIESVLNSIKGVKESCAIQRNNKIHAVLILEGKIKCEDVIKEANARLLSHQTIAGCSVWRDMQFPKTPTGKVKRFILQQELDKTDRHKKYAYENKVYGLIHQVLDPGKEIKQNSKLVELGMDSLKRVEMISELEKQFDVEIDETRIDKNTTALDIEKLMKESRITSIKFRAWPTMPFVRVFRHALQVFLLFPLIRFFTRTEYKGLENLANIEEPVIIVSNHQSAFDIPVITRRIKMPFAVAAHPEVVFGIGVGGIQKILRKLLGYCSSFAYNAYPFGAAIGTGTSLEFTGEMIDRGFSIILFPEGERTPDGNIHDFKSGVGYIVAGMEAKVIPVRINGLFEVLPRGSSIPRFGKTSVIFGKPIQFSSKQLSKMTYDGITKLIEQKVRSL